jgi:hypothetical protein
MPRTPRERPDSRPARLMMGAGALAAATVIGAGLVDYPMAVAEQPSATTDEARATAVKQVERKVRYVRLKPGQKAPKGAKVIREAAPTPRVVVRRVVVREPSRNTRPVARSRQSGG